jgi:hypothetical protein
MKSVKQIDLALKNEPGSLLKVIDLLGANGINMVAFHVAVENGRPILHFIPNDPNKALQILRTTGVDLKEKEVLACEIPHHPGGLSAVLRPLTAAGINVDYTYPCLGTGEDPILILGVSNLKKATAALEENWIRLLGAELYSF